MSNPSWLTEWRHRRGLRKLGKVNVHDSMRYNERAQLDAMPGQFNFKQEAHRFKAAMWVTGNREAPQLEGNLWRIEKELAAKRRSEALSKHRRLKVV